MVKNFESGRNTVEKIDENLKLGKKSFIKRLIIPRLPKKGSVKIDYFR